MSIYTVNRMCHQLMHDKNFRHRMQTVPEQVVGELDLTFRERELILAGEVGQLHLMGVNAFLLGYLTRFEVLGLTLPIYNERMRAVAGQTAIQDL